MRVASSFMVQSLASINVYNLTKFNPEGLSDLFPGAQIASRY